jgi:hypothetical protein
MKVVKITALILDIFFGVLAAIFVANGLYGAIWVAVIPVIYFSILRSYALKGNKFTKLTDILAIIGVFIFWPFTVIYFVMKSKEPLMATQSSTSTTTQNYSDDEEYDDEEENEEEYTPGFAAEVKLTGATPMEQMLELKDLLDNGKISQETYNKKIAELL